MSDSMLNNIISTIRYSFSVDCVCYELFFGQLFSKCNRTGSHPELSELGYDFNLKLQLRKLKLFNYPTTEPFDYYISKDPEECRIHYEKVGEAVNDYIYRFLMWYQNLDAVVVPVKGDPKCCTHIFMSQFCPTDDVTLILIQGSGAIRAGQWSRSVIIYEGMHEGSQYPYIKKAREKNYGLMILNPNENFKDGKKIPRSGSPIEHARYVWDSMIRISKASKILIMGHGYGGTVALALANYRIKAFEKRVKAIALIDSIHEFSKYKVTGHFKKVSKNWISSTAPLDTELKTPYSHIKRVSTGHPQSKKSPNICIDSVFNFFDEMVAKSIESKKELNVQLS